ncbi:MAG: hypothetical protein BRC45_10415 [Cyanobacteria bacterium QS_5_48_63]|nr:MAG: hypothetical protein BRC45_10415 [Cyanobacteria bacterium QS_5_48_63]
MTKKDAGTQRAEEQRGREAEEKRAALRNYFPSAPKQLKMQNAKFLIFNRRAEICDARASLREHRLIWSKATLRTWRTSAQKTSSLPHLPTFRLCLCWLKKVSLELTQP